MSIMHISLYRSYRPRSFSDVIGQDAAVHVIRTAIHRDTVGHAYLFSGPRGSGKTSLARLLAKAVNCAALSGEGEPCGKCINCMSISRGDHLDVIEIDGASNNGVDEVRELRAKVSLAPFSASYKVYIIDEVHMLSTAAFNALLKTVEEPPEHVIFILATTEPHKVPVTIRSRCQHIPFHRIAVPSIRQRLRQVCEQEGFEIQEEALWELARQADGALRDALSLLEQAVTLSSGDLTMEGVCRMLGGGTRPEVERWLVLLRKGVEEAHHQLQTMVASGVSPERFLDQVFLLFRDLWVVRKWGESVVSGLDLSEQEEAFLVEEAPHWSEGDLSRAMDHCLRLFGRVRLGIRGDVFVGAMMTGLLSKPVEFPAGRDARGRGSLSEQVQEQPRSQVPETSHSNLSDRERESRSSTGEMPQKFQVPYQKRNFSADLPSPASRKSETVPTAPIAAKRTVTWVGDPNASFAEDPKQAWRALMEDLRDQDLSLFAALSRCEAVLDAGKGLTIRPPVDFPFLIDLVSQERHAWRLVRLCQTRGLAEPLRLVVGDKEMPFSVPPEGEPEDVLPGSSGTLFQVPLSVSGSTGEGKKMLSKSQGEGGDPDSETEEVGVEKDVDRIRRWFSSEVLLMKKDTKDEEDSRSEEAVEEGATEI